MEEVRSPSLAGPSEQREVHVLLPGSAPQVAADARVPRTREGGSRQGDPASSPQSFSSPNRLARGREVFQGVQLTPQTCRLSASPSFLLPFCRLLHKTYHEEEGSQGYSSFLRPNRVTYLVLTLSPAQLWEAALTSRIQPTTDTPSPHLHLHPKTIRQASLLVRLPDQSWDDQTTLNAEC